MFMGLNQITLAALSSVPGGGLMLARRHSHDIRIFVPPEGGIGILLDGDTAWSYVETRENRAWKGRVILNTRIEVDISSFHRDEVGAKLGSLVFKGDHVSMVVRLPSRFDRSSTTISLQGPEPLANQVEGWFTKWRLIVGEGQDQKVVAEVEATEIAPI